jgi:hypothetical protein
MSKEERKTLLQGFERFGKMAGEEKLAQLKALVDELEAIMEKYDDIIVLIAMLGFVDGAEASDPKLAPAIKAWHQRAAVGLRSWEQS